MRLIRAILGDLGGTRYPPEVRSHWGARAHPLAGHVRRLDDPSYHPTGRPEYVMEPADPNTAPSRGGPCLAPSLTLDRIS